MKWAAWLLSMHILAAADMAGVYNLSGVREMASQLVLNPDGTFEYALIYGAADYIAKGKWTAEGDSVVLNTDATSKPAFRLARSSASKQNGVRLFVKAANGQPVANIDVVLDTPRGEVKERTDQQGEVFAEGLKSASAAAFVVRVYSFESDLIKIPAGHNLLEFEINGEAITQVKFEKERLRIDGPALELRFWNRDEKPMRYTKGR
jgi:uncharacterized protein